jgi:hypothetical protein
MPRAGSLLSFSKKAMSLKLTEAGSPELDYRIPYRMKVAGDELLFYWLYVGKTHFDEPFFSETIASCLSLPENSFQPLPVTTAAALIEQAARVDAVEPSAFIFHISRCGSTLLTQMLSQEKSFIVLPEVPLLDEVLRLPYKHPALKPLVEPLFRAVLRLLGQKRSGTESHLFVKTDSWHLMYHGELREWFPQVPALLLYRSPAEVIGSHKKHWGVHAVPGILEPEIFGFDGEAVKELFPEPYLVLVLETYFRKMLQILSADKNAVAASYHDGPMQMLSRLSGICGLQLQPGMLSKMEARTLHHSKDAGNKFAVEPPAQFAEPENPALEKLLRALDEAVSTARSA